MTADPVDLVRDVMDAACEYHGTDWYDGCEACDYQLSGIAALAALVAERDDYQSDFESEQRRCAMLQRDLDALKDVNGEQYDYDTLLYEYGEKCRTLREYQDYAKGNKARAEAAEARVAELEAELADAKRRRNMSELTLAGLMTQASEMKAALTDMTAQRDAAVAANEAANQRADAAEAEAAKLRETAIDELEAVSRWAGEQNAGNAFAQQVRMWALAKLAALGDGA